MRKSALAITLALSLGTTSAMAASQSEASQAILDAVKANNEAASIGFEWRDTYKKLLGPAKKAFKKGEYDKAMDLAKTAKAHALLAKEQYARAQNADLHN